MSDFRLDLDDRAIADLMSSHEVEDLLQDVGDDIASRATEKAPKRTGAGAESIHCEVHTGSDSGAFASTHTPDGDLPTAYVGWDQDHYYMLFAEVGTEHEPAEPFLRPALDETTL